MSCHLSYANTSWRSIWPPPILALGEAHLWRVPVVETPIEEEYACSVLSIDELERVRLFKLPLARRQFITGRAAIRLLAATYLNKAPKDIAIEFGINGKPRLQNPLLDLAFNLSHSDKYCLIAWALNTDIGVDTELQDASIEVDTLCELVFSNKELLKFKRLTKQDATKAFFRTWTRKEAFIKAKGAGLSLPLKSFGVSQGLEENVQLIHVNWNPEEIDEWEFHSFELSQTMPAALATNRKNMSCLFFDLALNQFF